MEEKSQRLDIEVAKKEARYIKEVAPIIRAQAIEEARSKGDKKTLRNLEQASPDDFLTVASEKADSIKKRDPVEYEITMELYGILSDIEASLGQERAKALIQEFDHEKGEIITEIRRGDMQLGDYQIASSAIGRLSQRPSFKDVETETWGKLFAFNMAAHRKSIYLAEGVYKRVQAIIEAGLALNPDR